MQYRSLGNTGLFVSAFSLGSWVTFKHQLNVETATDLIATAYENGINVFDNAETYGDGLSEEIMGKAFSKLSFKRSSYCISSKVYWGGDAPTQKGLSRKHVIEACHEALIRLNVEYLDLYYCHRPDPDTPIIETVRAMDTLVKQGKILYWGTSEWELHQISEAFLVARENNLTPPSMEQAQYNFFERQKIEGDFSQLYKKYGLGTTTWSPLCSGILTGKYKNGVPNDSRLAIKEFAWLKDIFYKEENKQKIKDACELEKIALEIGLSLTHFSLAWCLKNKNVSSVILGASTKEQLLENIQALEHIDKISEDALAKVNSLLTNTPAAPIDWKQL